MHEFSDAIRSFVSPERRDLADAVRHLLDAVLTAEDAPDAALAAAARDVERVTTALVGHSDAHRGARTRRETSHGDYLHRSPLVGTVNPAAAPFAYQHRDARLHADGVFHAAYEGPPGYVHGGWIALAFDEVLGMANVATGHPAMTGRLSVRYRRPTPLHVPVHIEAWTEQVDGRRVVARATMAAGGAVTAEAEGLFVKLGDELALAYFGREPSRDEGPDPLP
ncbi:MAG: PaaI family thioesterase [Acidimicrobiia bacterium]